MSLLDNIHNYYESLVIENLAERVKNQNLDLDDNVLTDVVCIALNHLPPRYIRHEVDFVYYTSPIEQEETRLKAKSAVDNALVFVNKSERVSEV